MSRPEPIRIDKRVLALDHPSYFIADIAANHDGDLQRAKDLIWLAKEAGADCAKFQHFKAEKIVSDRGFRALGGQQSHQAAWKKPVFEVYRQHELNREWNIELVATARSAGIHFMTTPYDDEAVDTVNALVPAWKIGSGDITYLSLVEKVARTGKPILVASGASTQADVDRAVKAVLSVNRQLVLMQCNTNYTGSLANFRYINLNVLKTYAARYPGLLLGLSDHSPGHATVLGAIALGARAIEKHFTDDNGREGPDHSFAMNPRSWREMVERSRELEAALGDGVKRVEDNEAQTAVLQQRCLRTTRNLPAGHVLTAVDLEALRPAPEGAARPFELPQLLGRHLLTALQAGDALMHEALAVRAPSDAAAKVVPA
ncbi:MAG: N-acetylneuraminate synthase family protein [Rubrivivax sp.]|nr:N-acetylneuraminate synthase family protein [Rubrivivax sp.]MDP3222148.1 N-acetylneuraminate synthase family protein [Rubrivivax sp.]MDP3615632.1 N-acetylneuraminate synthase family protein [Rubrivivax sp.]